MGVGVLWARQELLEAMPPYQAGSNMAHEVDLASQHFSRAAHKFGAGTPNVADPIGLAAAIAYLEAVGRDVLHEHEQALTIYGLERLREVPGLRVLGPQNPGDRLPVFTFTLAGFAPAEILRFLDARGIAVRAGDLAALPLLRRLGVESAARASCYLYTHTADIDTLVTGLHALLAEVGHLR
jgi:cysteine desulfurase/selenocysteine lyase